MYYSDRVTLVGRTTSLDAIGNAKHKETKTEVWADVLSPSRAEVTSAGANGLKPSYVVKVHRSDYSGQTVVEVDGRRLTVYRTFRAGENVELYVHDKRGESNEN